MQRQSRQKEQHKESVKALLLGAMLPFEPCGVKPLRNCTVVSVLVMNWPPFSWYGSGMLCSLLCQV